jgi:aspartate/methionine/tyrosine aminotransferase
MKFPISRLIEQVHFPPISEVRRWIAESPCQLPIVDLCQAIPDYPPAPALNQYLQSIIDDPLVSKYTPDEGLPEAREAICRRYTRIYCDGPNPGQICLTVGASQAFWLAMITLCQAGDEIILQCPAYFDHPMTLEMLGLKTVFVPFSETTSGLLSPDDVEACITPRTKAILAVSPSNPTGAVTSAATIRGLFELARARNIAFILDETYSDFIPGGQPPHDLFTDPAWSDHFIQIMSFGKTYALTGYRAGCLVASEKFIHNALKAQDTMTVCQPRITQMALKFATENLDSWVAANREMMTTRHDAFVREFGKSGNPFRLVASGTFFAWVRHPFTGLTGREAAKKLAHESGVMVLPGEVFGPGLEPYLRLAFGNIKDDDIPMAVERFRAITV